METSHNTMELAQHNKNKLQHNKILTNQWKQTAKWSKKLY